MGTPQTNLPVRLGEWTPAPRQASQAAQGFWNNSCGGSPIQEEGAEPGLGKGTVSTEALPGQGGQGSLRSKGRGTGEDTEP